MKIDDVLNYKIGIIGLGVLGSAIAECFINKKIRLIGYDLSDKFYKKLNKSFFSSASSIDELYSESKIVARFWILGILLAVLSIVTLKIR